MVLQIVEVVILSGVLAADLRKLNLEAAQIKNSIRPHNYWSWFVEVWILFLACAPALHYSLMLGEMLLA